MTETNSEKIAALRRELATEPNPVKKQVLAMALQKAESDQAAQSTPPPSEPEHIKVERLSLLQIDDPQKAWDILDEYAGLYGDNGGDPDGDLYLAEESDIPADKVEAVLQAKAGKKVKGWRIDEYTEPSNYSNWCGYSSKNVAYTTDHETANAIAIDEYGIKATKG